MTREKLNKMLKNHLHWERQDCVGWESMKADFRNADFRGANLRNVDLRGADLSNADLRGASLCGANLHKASLRRADLRGANLYEAYLCKADLSGANFRGANLFNAALCGANLDGAYFCGTDLREIDFSMAKNVPFIPIVCPDKGSFIGYKQAHGLIVELEICEDAKRSSATGRKCRCDKAKVISITTRNGDDAEVTEVASNFDNRFIYKVGEIVEEPNFCEDRFDECSKGIHFFINRQEAVEW